MLKFSLQNSLQSFNSLFLIWCERLPIYGNLKQRTSDVPFNWFWLLENLRLRYFLMTLSIKNGGYAFVIRLDLMLSMSSWKEFQLLQILNNLFIKYLIKLISYENDVKLLKFMRRPVYLLLNPSSKMTKRFYNIARTTASTSKFIY